MIPSEYPKRAACETVCPEMWRRRIFLPKMRESETKRARFDVVITQPFVTTLGEQTQRGEGETGCRNIAR